jgi:hypothetical protein
MQEFGLSLSGLANDRTLMDEKLIRAVRFMVEIGRASCRERV